MAVDARGRPLAIRITPGQTGVQPEVLPTLAAISVPTGHRDRGQGLLPSTRRALRGKGIGAVMRNQTTRSTAAARGSSGGRPPDFDPDTHNQRNVVERGLNRLKQWRGIATRYDKKACNCRAGVVSWVRSSCAASHDPPDRP
jgi:transposase